MDNLSLFFITLSILQVFEFDNYDLNPKTFKFFFDSLLDTRIFFFIMNIRLRRCVMCLFSVYIPWYQFFEYKNLHMFSTTILIYIFFDNFFCYFEENM